MKRVRIGRERSSLRDDVPLIAKNAMSEAPTFVAVPMVIVIGTVLVEKRA